VSIIVEETEVLTATAKYLAKRGVLPYRFSLPSGQRTDVGIVKKALSEPFRKFGVEPEFVGSGPDVIGFSDTEWWAVECKGLGAGKPSTLRNNFDRALASTVSYFDECPPEPHQDRDLYLGLALPLSEQYLRELRRRVRSPLRQRLNLWVLLFDPRSNQIYAVQPDSSYDSVSI